MLPYGLKPPLTAPSWRPEEREEYLALALGASQGRGWGYGTDHDARMTDGSSAENSRVGFGSILEGDEDDSLDGRRAGRRAGRGGETGSWAGGAGGGARDPEGGRGGTGPNSANGFGPGNSGGANGGRLSGTTNGAQDGSGDGGKFGPLGRAGQATTRMPEIGEDVQFVHHNRELSGTCTDVKAPHCEVEYDATAVGTFKPRKSKLWIHQRQLISVGALPCNYNNVLEPSILWAEDASNMRTRRLGMEFCTFLRDLIVHPPSIRFQDNFKSKPDWTYVWR